MRYRSLTNSNPTLPVSLPYPRVWELLIKKRESQGRAAERLWALPPEKGGVREARLAAWDRAERRYGVGFRVLGVCLLSVFFTVEF